jgi:hypothetical protein
MKHDWKWALMKRAAMLQYGTFIGRWTCYFFDYA